MTWQEFLDEVQKLDVKPDDIISIRVDEDHDLVLTTYSGSESETRDGVEESVYIYGGYDQSEGEAG